MKVELPPLWGAIPQDPKDLPQYVGHMVELLARLTQSLQLALNGQITLGDGVSKDNLAGSWVTYTTTGDEDEVEHNLGVVPVGFFLLVPPAYGVVNVGPTTWTSSKLYLMCGEASQEVTIFVLAPPRQIL